MVSRVSVPRIVVTGSGSLARSVCYSLATELTTPATVSILARAGGKAAELAFVASVRARVSERAVVFYGRGVDFADLDGVLGELAPDLVVHCVSHQSPWERGTAPSAWTELLRMTGFGLTLPLQAELLIDVAESLRRVAPDCLLINACFPDAVNPVAHALGFPVFCGIGNISTISAAIAATLDWKDHRSLHLLAHHLHLHAPADTADEARVWCENVERDDVRALLAGMRSTARAELNQIGGHAAARLIDSLLTGGTTDTHVPSPLGLPGGYPVRIRDRSIELRLPKGIDAEAAIAWNQRMALLDGVVVDGGQVRFAPSVGEHVPEFAEPFPVTEIRYACARLLALRERLREVAP
ncbi:hypothetical protein Atai01_69190 [Amycolatopsis taiwanensis]|uniref:Saccharopine dehydrogenase NADP binding domain-containing protein n=1 Tax=Amycolatopsis taiwanensis TaxID=342230 RepID=A0A9W6RAA8_9PSEU|nr:hypothetical protein Atai01_69190 [Amycolatopsis taiwanensis]